MGRGGEEWEQSRVGQGGLEWGGVRVGVGWGGGCSDHGHKRAVPGVQQELCQVRGRSGVGRGRVGRGGAGRVRLG